MKTEFTENYGMHSLNTIYKEIILPFKIPKVQTYPYFSSLIGILDAHECADIWIYNNYILIWALKDISDVDYWVDFKFGNEEIQEDFCLPLTKEIVQRDLVGNDSVHILAFIYESLVKEKYIFTSIDVFYIDKWWKNTESKKHFRHQICIIGINIQEKTLIIGDFIIGKYQVIKITFNEFLEGYFNYDTYIPYEEFGGDNWLVSYNGKAENINLGRICSLLRDFINSSDTALINHIQTENKIDQYVFGLDVFDKLIKYINIVKQKKRRYLDRRPFHILREMQKNMSKRMYYIFKHYSYENEAEIKEITEQSTILSHNVEAVCFLVIKYTICFDFDLLSSIIYSLKEIKEKEKNFLIKCLSVLEEIVFYDKKNMKDVV